ncbi:MAG: phenylalanine--tRNA ligase subunit alpha [Acidobacteria bacterium]|nr:MAG: phenylalanine--tRNA ligase subunit alpha [Acidobacteriota bacterium]
MPRSPQEVRDQFDQEIAQASTPEDLERIRVRYIGRKAGLVRELLQSLGSLPADERAGMGKETNLLQAHVTQRLSEATRTLAHQAPTTGKPALDPTLPGRLPGVGLGHPIARVEAWIQELFLEMGYSVEDGPEVETDFHNFEALNIPPHHPARDMQDTFYLSDKTLLRTHTSPVQIRTMQSRQPPLKIIAPGKVFRRDSDITHSPMFHQVEGLVVAEGISLADLKGTLGYFCRRIFGESVRLRVRPSYFPFVEPGAEYDVSCILCGGEGCRSCGRTGWLEMGGCGMVHPAVFEAVGYDPERWTGFAFGLGIDRIVMLKYGVHDIRLLFENDLRFLSQFQDG